VHRADVKGVAFSRIGDRLRLEEHDVGPRTVANRASKANAHARRFGSRICLERLGGSAWINDARVQCEVPESLCRICGPCSADEMRISRGRAKVDEVGPNQVAGGVAPGFSAALQQ
jgi:hypothetical protein